MITREEGMADAIKLLKAFQSRLGASVQSLGGDEDDISLWNRIDKSIKSLEAQLANTEQLTCDKNCANCSNLRNGYCIILQRKMTSDINSISKTHWLKSISCNDFKLKDTQ